MIISKREWASASRKPQPSPKVWVWARKIGQWKRLCFIHGQPKFQLGHLIWSPKHGKVKSLGIDTRISPEHYRVYFKIKTGGVKSEQGLAPIRSEKVHFLLPGIRASPQLCPQEPSVHFQVTSASAWPCQPSICTSMHVLTSWSGIVLCSFPWVYSTGTMQLSFVGDKAVRLVAWASHYCGDGKEHSGNLIFPTDSAMCFLALSSLQSAEYYYISFMQKNSWVMGPCKTWLKISDSLVSSLIFASWVFNTTPFSPGIGSSSHSKHRHDQTVWWAVIDQATHTPSDTWSSHDTCSSQWSTHCPKYPFFP